MCIPWTAPIAAVVACCGVVTIVGPADLWLGASLLAAAIAILILPAVLSLSGAQVASTASAPSAVSQPADAVEAGVRQPWSARHEG